MEPKNLLWFIRSFIVATLSNAFIAFWRVVDLWNDVKYSPLYLWILTAFIIILLLFLYILFDFSNKLSYKIEEKQDKGGKK